MNEQISRFEQHLITEEKSRATMEKYLHDVRCFAEFLAERAISKEETISYKEYLTQQYAPASVNSMLVALNCFLRFVGRTAVSSSSKSNGRCFAGKKRS